MTRDPYPGPGQDDGEPLLPGGGAGEWYLVPPPDDPDYDPDAILDQIIAAAEAGAAVR